VIARGFEASSNVLSTSSSVTLQIGLTKPDEKPEFLNDWAKYGPKFLSSTDMQLVDEVTGIEKLNQHIERRLLARKAKNFTEADRIRDELAVMGIELKDSMDPKTGELVTTWEVAR
jgi:cysteinyl-tRNA synthetase